MPDATLEQRMTALEQTVRELQEAMNARCCRVTKKLGVTHCQNQTQKMTTTRNRRLSVVS
jgi:hypothetical protein